MSKSEDDAPSAPEQAHGDALAALDRILLRGDNAKCGDFQIVRKALTDGGVPYVPESVVDEIVDEFEWMAEDEDGRDASHTPADWERLMLKDFAMLLLSEAPNRTEVALASAPAVPEIDGLPPLRQVFEIARSRFQKLAEYHDPMSVPYGIAATGVKGCNEALRALAAAPSDGGSHE